jgi:hypothetical protein
MEWTTSCPSSVPLITFSSRLSNDTHVIRDFCLSKACVGLKLRVRCRPPWASSHMHYSMTRPQVRHMKRVWRDRSTFTTLPFLRSQSFTMPSEPPVQICVCRAKEISRQQHAQTVLLWIGRDVLMRALTLEADVESAAQ